MATTERRKDKSGQVQESTEWHNITAFGSLADIASKYIRKGAQVAVEGRLRTRDWTDKAGVRRFTTEIVASNIQLLGGRRDSQQEAAMRKTQAQAPYNPAPQPVQNQAYPPSSSLMETARATFRFRRQPRRRAGLIAAN